MIPVVCQIEHDPEAGTYGDCVRACVASILELEPCDVPHFYHDNCDAETGTQRLHDFLASRHFAPFYASYSGALTLGELLEFMGHSAYGHFMLFGSMGGDGNHVVVCCGNKVVHDPAWYPTGLVKACASEADPNGVWTILVIAHL